MQTFESRLSLLDFEKVPGITHKTEKRFVEYFKTIECFLQKIIKII